MFGPHFNLSTLIHYYLRSFINYFSQNQFNNPCSYELKLSLYPKSHFLSKRSQRKTFHVSVKWHQALPLKDLTWLHVIHFSAPLNEGIYLEHLAQWASLHGYHLWPFDSVDHSRREAVRWSAEQASRAPQSCRDSHAREAIRMCVVAVCACTRRELEAKGTTTRLTKSKSGSLHSN